jgi:hypothetical protein
VQAIQQGLFYLDSSATAALLKELAKQVTASRTQHNSSTYAEGVRACGCGGDPCLCLSSGALTHGPTANAGSALCTIGAPVCLHVHPDSSRLPIAGLPQACGGDLRLAALAGLQPRAVGTVRPVRTASRPARPAAHQRQLTCALRTCT